MATTFPTIPLRTKLLLERALKRLETDGITPDSRELTLEVSEQLIEVSEQLSQHLLQQRKDLIDTLYKMQARIQAVQNAQRDLHAAVMKAREKDRADPH